MTGAVAGFMLATLAGFDVVSFPVGLAGVVLAAVCAVFMGKPS
jgi:hypothetical protein